MCTHHVRMHASEHVYVCACRHACVLTQTHKHTSNLAVKGQAVGTTKGFAFIITHEYIKLLEPLVLRVLYAVNETKKIRDTDCSSVC